MTLVTTEKEFVDNVALTSKWVNGGVDEVVDTPNGPILTLSAIARMGTAYVAMSPDSVMVSTGNKVFTIEAGKYFRAGQAVMIVADDNWMQGQISAYVGTALAVSVNAVGGSGQGSNWLIGLAAGTGDASEEICQLPPVDRVRDGVLFEMQQRDDDSPSGYKTYSATSGQIVDHVLESMPVGTDPGDFVQLGQSGKLPAVDGSQLENLPHPPQVNADWNATSDPAQILNKPAIGALPLLVATISGMTGLIDLGTWLQIDFGREANVRAYNGLTFTANSDGTASLPDGIYMVCGGINMTTNYLATYLIPPQMTVATGQVYAFPGQPGYCVQALPSTPLTTSKLWPGGSAGFSTISGVLTGVKAVNGLWLGVSKVQDTTAAFTVVPVGSIAYIKIG
ncbi:hypothetical protein [Paraburkholderia sediminicola]|uniref:hypothetical protein n=1 Tax=Paraburkholderia sediminicola TaxID=458836 RepID=UPI0038BC58FB